MNRDHRLVRVLRRARIACLCLVSAFCAVFPHVAFAQGACCRTTGACTFVTQSACITVGGVFHDAVPCAPNPCILGACCAADGSCFRESLGACEDDFGTWRGANTTCTPTNPCPQGNGSCCAHAGNCTFVVQSACTAAGSVWTGNAACFPNVCPQPGGACCHSDGTCAFAGRGGSTCVTWTIDVACAPNPCRGPCCQYDGTCTLTAPEPCAGVGAFLGVGAACSAVSCPPHGSCCNFSTGLCVVTEQSQCASGNGFLVGAACTCLVCPLIGPCCNPGTGTCSITTRAGCPYVAREPAIFDRTPWQAGSACTPTVCDNRGCAAQPGCARGGACCSGTTCVMVVIGECLDNWLGAQTCSPSACPALAPNADCSQAINLSLNQPVSGTFVGAPSYPPNRSVWFRFVAPAAGPYTFTASATGCFGVVRSPADPSSVVRPSSYIGIDCYVDCSGDPSHHADGSNPYDAWTYDTLPGSMSVVALGQLSAGQDVQIAVDGSVVLTGPFTVVANNNPILGACCDPYSGCRITVRPQCRGGIHGTYQGDFTTCAPNPCALPPTGACCDLSGACVLTTQVNCLQALGNWNGGAACITATCLPYRGACCQGSTCVFTFPAYCTGTHARFTGVSTVCNAAGNNTSPCCKGDYNQSGAVTVQDIFDFLAGYFTGSPEADINGSGGATVQDIFEFMAVYFRGCP